MEKRNVVDLSKIKVLRENRGLTQEFVAAELDLSRPSYALIEQGQKDITVNQLYTLADLLKVSVKDIANGFSDQKSLDYTKFKDLILECVRKGADSDGKITKTKLAKLVYLSDFNWFFLTNKSMTGATYRCIARGPVADDYFRALDEMSDNQSIAIESRGPALMVSLVESRNADSLDSDEKTLIDNICRKWHGRPTHEIVEFTHRQNPWKSSEQGSAIPYELILSESQANLY